MPPELPATVTTTETRTSRARTGAPSVLSSITYYTAGRYTSEFLYAIRGLLLASLLGPRMFGLWTKMKLTLLFLQYAQLGSHEAMLREVPDALGVGDRRRATEIERSVLGFSLTVSILVAVAIIAIASVRQGEASAEQRAWILLAVVFPLSQLYWFVHLKLRAEKAFGRVSYLMVGLALSTTVLGCWAAARFGLEGFLVVLAASHLLMVMASHVGRDPLARPAWNLERVRVLLRVGSPIMLSGALLILLWNVDKLAIWAFLSRESLGIYALPSYFLMTVMMIPEAVSAVLYPHLVERISSAESAPEALGRYFIQPTLIIGYLAAPAVGLLFLVLHLPIRWLLPEYVAGITPGRILIAALFFAALTRIPYVALLALSRQRSLVVMTLGAVLFGALVISGLIASGYGLEGAAFGAASTYLLYSLVLIGSCLAEAGLAPRDLRRFLGDLLLPFVAVTLVVALALWLLPESDDSLPRDLGTTLLRCLAVATVGGALLWRHRQRLFTAHPSPTTRSPAR